MSAETSLTSSDADARPTHVRHWVIAVATLMSVLLYLDRFAVGIASEYIREDLRMTQTQMSWFLSAFFWSYALAQVPAGWFSDRFGSRRMLTLYILAWSVFTGLLGMAFEVSLVIYLRLFIGVAQAGAYPTSAALIRHWFPISNRGTASSLVGLGGRFGAVLAPILTAWLIVAFVSHRPVPSLADGGIYDRRELLIAMQRASQSDQAKDRLLKRHYESLSREDRVFLDRCAEVLTDATAEHELDQKRSPFNQQWNPWSFLEWRNWFPPLVAHPSTEERPDELLHFGLMSPEVYTQQLAVAADQAELVDDDVAVGLTLPRAARRLLRKRQAGTELSREENRLLNRLALEAVAPRAIRKHVGPGWRPTIIVYGALGLIVAMAFFFVCRDTPKQHPWCNDAERNIIHDEDTLAVMRVEPRDAAFPWQAMLTNVSLWGNSMMQFTTNVGWLFVVTWLPRYLDKVHGVSLVQQGIMTAIPSGVGILTLFVGGRWTDIAARRFGLKWGRRLPILLTRFSAAAGYGMCLLLSLAFDPNVSKAAEFNWLPWAYVFGLSFAAASVDLGMPAVWAFAQDVGGKYTGSILGWANMWGNLGAAAAPLIYNAVLGEHPSLGQWNAMFGVCLLAFVISGLCALVIDATKPLVRESTA